MIRREFISVVMGAAGASFLPLPVPDSYQCDCGLVTYFKQPDGHYAATHFAGQRFTYALFRQHEHLHRKMDKQRGSA